MQPLDDRSGPAVSLVSCQLSQLAKLTNRTPPGTSDPRPPLAAGSSSTSQMAAQPPEKRPPRSLFELPSDFFDSSVLLRAHPSTAPSVVEPSEPSRPPPPPTTQQQQLSEAAGSRWTCNTCAAEFESLQEQREHFKSDLHRLNVSICALSLHLTTSDWFLECYTAVLIQF